MNNSDNLVCFFESLQTLANNLSNGLRYPSSRRLVRTLVGSGKTRQIKEEIVSTIGDLVKYQKESQQLSSWISSAQKNLSITSFPKPTTCRLPNGDNRLIPTIKTGSVEGWEQAVIKLQNSFQTYMQQAGINPSLSQSEFNSLVSILNSILNTLKRRLPGL